MLNVNAEIILDGVTILSPDNYGNLHIYQFIQEGLPYGYFNLNDRGGLLIQKFESFEIGTRVNITLREITDESEKTWLKFPEFRILKIEDDFSDLMTFAGNIKIWFGHPWFLFKDTKNHAYNPMNNGKLIEKILKDETRGIKLEKHPDKLLFCETDDTGEYSRYKVTETDWDFIQNKILPYSTIENLPPLFFNQMHKKKNEKVYQHRICLTNSAKIFKQKSKIIIIPPREAIADDESAKQIGRIAKNNGLKEGDTYSFGSLNLKVSYEKFLTFVSSAVFLDDIETGRSLKVNSELANKLAPGDLLPLNASFMMQTGGIWAGVVKNRIFNDAAALIIGSGRELDDTFVLVAELDTYCGHKIGIGDTVEFFAPKVSVTSDPENKKTPWLNGKWIITGLEDVSSEEDPSKMTNTLYLSKPSFSIDKRDTTLTKYRTLFEV